MITRLLSAILLLSLISCSSTAVKEGDDLYHSGSLAENTSFEYTKTELASGTKITSLKVGKDQQSLLRYLALMKNTPALINAGGDALSSTVDQVSKLIE
jgi:hypothetical protein